MADKFLIFINKTDITSDFIIREMKRRGLKATRINTEDAMQWAIIQNFSSGTILKINETIINLDEIKSSYFRRPLSPEIAGTYYPLSVVKYIQEEWNYLLRSIYLELDKKWFSHPNWIILAEDKPRQIRLANDIGFKVPETVITNEISAIKYLFESGNVIAKPLKQSLLEDEGEVGKVIFTSKINSLAEIDEQALRSAPVIFQRKISKKYDLRITVVEDQLFSVAIESQIFDRTKIDWRCGSIVELEHKIFELPPDIQEYCKKIVKKLGLRFGAIDLILDEKGEFWFLECNPNGQWAWIENRTGLPIAAAIVDVMEKFP